MKSYIVRIYRQGKDTAGEMAEGMPEEMPEEIIGQVEDTETSEKTGFRNGRELLSALKEQKNGAGGI